MDQSDLLNSIVSYLHKQITETKDVEFIGCINGDEAALFRLMFFAHTKQLTKIGDKIMRKYFEHYHFTLPKDSIVTLRHLRYFQKETIMPFFFSYRELTVFDEFMGTMLIMVDADLDKMVEIA